MSGRFLDLLGTVYDKLQIGIGSTANVLKTVSGVLRIRNKGDSADAALVASKVSASGDDIDINEDAAGSGADWKLTLRRPSSGMSEDRVVVFPSGNPTVGQALYVAAYGSNTVELDYLTVAAGSDKDVTDTTTLAFGSTSPVAMFTKPDPAVIQCISVVIDTAFDGTPSASVGITGTTSKYLAATQIDLTAAAGTVFEVNPGLAAAAGEALIITYSAGGASVGSARFLVTYVEPS